MRRLALFLLPLCLIGAPSLALEPDNLLLLTNKNVPEGRKLAEFYAAKRKVPDQRVLELDLPPGEQITFDAYEKQVVPAVRDFIAANNLQAKVTCLLTFYGLPLKIAPRVNGPADQAELAGLHREQQMAHDELAVAVAGVEGMAQETDPTFTPATDATLNGLAARDRAARTVLGGRAMQLKDPARFEAFMARAEKLTEPLVGAAPQLQQRLKVLAALAADHRTQQQQQEAETINNQLLQMRARFDRLQAHRGDPTARAELRALVKEQVGLIEYARVIDGMIDYFVTDATGAAFDSELALVQWNFYSRARSLPNPMHFKGRRADMPPILMTMRLDAPEPMLVRAMILGGVKAEAEGLQGRVVVDSGGHLSIDSKSTSYAAFDQTLRNLATIISTKTKLPLTFDEKREVLPPHSVKDPVALYCGWYALQHYTPACTFFPGAVGYHVASFELVTLHEPSPQWCHGLLTDGIAATLGAVNEPFLNAFPPPDEFFPLLLTGKLTLAEVYWKTTPMVSWQIAMIGDPLYTPYKLHPPLAPEALDEALQGALKPAR
jgi:uncharacterized protein (TIGR03790 family)